MKTITRNALISTAVGLATGVTLLIGAAPANASTSTPVPSAAGGTVAICSGISANLDDSEGNPLPLDVQQRMIDHLTLKCANPDAPSSGMYTKASQARVTPLGTVTPVGDISANLSITPGLMSWSASASGMSYGVAKTLDCEIQIAGGSFSNCGTAEGSGTSLTTRTNQDCPVPGQSVEVDAWLTIGSAQYYDSAYGTTQ